MKRDRLSREELIVLVRRIMAAEGETEEEADRLIEEFSANVPDPEAEDLIFGPNRHFDHEPSAEEVVDRALSFTPIELGPGSGS